MPSPAEYLTLPYERVLIPDEASGTFTALIRELPGCVSQGDTPAEAYANLEDAAESWIGAALEVGQTIPAPRAAESHGGRVLLRLPRSLHREASEAAERDGTSLNQFILTAVAYRLGGKAAEAARSAQSGSPTIPT
jgi:predicted RNase H-like HicB family nuclease